MAHVGIQLETLIQASVRLKNPMWVLYCDMAQFFPSLDRRLLRMHEIAAGVPKDVLDLAASIYGRGLSDTDGTPCRYDSAAGLGGTFYVTVGALMGSVWSTGKAKFFVQSVVAAILMKVKGQRLWGGMPTTHGEAWARLCEFIFADDLAAAFSAVEELRLAWDIFRCWTTIMGQKLGIKKMLKTACTASAFDKHGNASVAKDPKLRMPAGSKDEFVPFFQADGTYKHLGSGRRLDGVCTESIAKITNGCKHAMRSTRKLKGVNQDDYCRVADVLLNGKVQWHNQTTYLTWKEADSQVEAPFRKEYNRRFKRVGSSARIQLYLGSRRHAWGAALSAMLAVIAECLSEAEDSQPRQAVRAAVALALVDWGCEGDPWAWQWNHLKDALEKSLERKVRPIGEVFMLGVAVAMENEATPEEGAPFRASGMPWLRMGEFDNWSGRMRENDPLHPERPHFRRSQSRLVFEPSANGGLGLAPEEIFLKAGMRAVGHFCTYDDDGLPRWLETVEEASKQHSHLKAGAKEAKAWTTVMQTMRSLTAPSEPEDDRHVSRSSSGAVECAREKIRAQELRSQQKGRSKLVSDIEAEIKGEGEALDTGRWERRIREAFDYEGPTAAAAVPEWNAGTLDIDEMAAGPRMFFDMKRKTSDFGGEARWMGRSRVGEDGYWDSWEKDRGHMLRGLVVDRGGWVTWESDGTRLTAEDAALRGAGVEMVVRARLALGEDVVVIDQPVAKDSDREGVFVNRQAVEHELFRYATWVARTGAQCVISMDGCRKEAPDGKGPCKAGWSARRSDGGEWHGVIPPPFNDNYMAEMRAQTAAAERAFGLGCRRIVLVFDATSPPEVLRRFIWSCNRKRQRIYRRDWLDSWWEALQKFETVVFLWQTSHAGAPSNEWADVGADEAAEGWDMDDVSIESVTYAAIEWTGADGQLLPKGVRAWASKLLQRESLKRLAATSGSTQSQSADDLTLKALKPHRERLADELLGARGQLGDSKRFWGQASRLRVAQHGCPFGCGCAFRWHDVAFRCSGASIKAARRGWADDVQGAYESIALQLPTHCKCRLGWERLKNRLAGRGGKLVEGSEEEVHLRRMIGGLFEKSGDKALDNEKWAKSRVEGVRESGFRLQELGRAATAEFENTMREELQVARKVSKFAYAWMKKVVDAGPKRASWLRELQRARDQAMAEVDSRVDSEIIGANDGARRRARVNLIIAFGRKNCETGIRAPPSEIAAVRQWARLAMAHRWRLNVLAQGLHFTEPASKIRLAAIAIARGFEDPAGIVDIVTWPELKERELRARAWWRRGGGHDANYAAIMDRWEIQAGRKGDESDRWPAEVITVRRPVGATGRRIGTQLDVRIRFRGTDADGNAWNDEWIPVVRLTKDLKDEARRIEIALYPVPAVASRPAGRRISPRLEHIYEIEETDIGDRLQQDWTDYACEAAAIAAGQ